MALDRARRVGETACQAISTADAAPPPQAFRASFARLAPASGRGSALPLLLPLNLNSSRFSAPAPM